MYSYSYQLHIKQENNSSKPTYTLIFDYRLNYEDIVLYNPQLYISENPLSCQTCSPMALLS